MKNKVRLRQVHLDFHTSEHIEGIGRDFDPGEFSRRLAEANVDSVTCFSRCHHGWMYYPSKKFPERIHPGLECEDLLGMQIDACHGLDIQVPVYLPIQWDHFTANEHPEWLVLEEDGRPLGNGPYEAGFYRQLCLNTPYRDIVVEQAVEVLETYPADGLFLDIINVRECSCSFCRSGMIKKGLNPEIRSDRQRYMRDVIADFTDYVSSRLRAVRPDIPIFYNHSHVRLSHRDIIGGFTHLELESLPSGGWGYWDFPVTVRYARTLGVPCIGQTGKFQTAWGDFNSLKTPEALQFECFRSLAFGAGCSIGDQLHPLGRLDEATYRLIGDIYSSVAAKEEWCRDASPVTEIAVVSPDRFEGTARGGISPDIQGCTRMLQEGGHQFNIIDEYEELDGYRLVVLPDNVNVCRRLNGSLSKFIKNGGAVITSYKSWLDGAAEDGERGCGLKSAGKAPFSPDFIVPEGILASGLPSTDHVMYHQAECVDYDEGWAPLAWVNKPYFNRSWEHFCSHKHTPTSFERAYPGVLQKSKHIHFIHPVFTTYNAMDPLWYKRLFLNAVDALMPDRILEHSGPSSLIATVNEQKEDRRYIVHLLHYIPERRGEAFDTIQDLIPLYNVNVKIRLRESVKTARIVPEGSLVALKETADGALSFIVDKLEGHLMLELNY